MAYYDILSRLRAGETEGDVVEDSINSIFTLHELAKNKEHQPHMDYLYLQIAKRRLYDVYTADKPLFCKIIQTAIATVFPDSWFNMDLTSINEHRMCDAINRRSRASNVSSPDFRRIVNSAVYNTLFNLKLIASSPHTGDIRDVNGHSDEGTFINVDTSTLTDCDIWLAILFRYMRYVMVTHKVKTFPFKHFTGRGSQTLLVNWMSEEDIKKSVDMWPGSKILDKVREPISNIVTLTSVNKSAKVGGMHMVTDHSTFESTMYSTDEVISMSIFLLIACLRNTALPDCIETARQLKKIFRDDESDHSQYFAGRIFTRADDPEWFSRLRAMQSRCMDVDDKRPTFIEWVCDRIDKQQFVVNSLTEHQQSPDWITLPGTGQTLNSSPTRTQEEVDVENSRTQSTMEDLRKKMLAARCARFAKKN